MMRIAIAMLIAAMLASPTDAQTASEKAAARVRELLDPAFHVSSLEVSAPAPRVGPERIERPEVKLPIIDAPPPPLSQPNLKPVRPAPPAEPSLVTTTFAAIEFPSAKSLPDGVLYQQIVLDSKSAPPLPFLGAYVKDRVSLADPTAELSAFAILRPLSPERSNPAAFSPWNLPDPFENGQAIQLREPWAEIVELPLWRKPAGVK